MEFLWVLISLIVKVFCRQIKDLKLIPSIPKNQLILWSDDKEQLLKVEVIG